MIQRRKTKMTSSYTAEEIDLLWKSHTIRHLPEYDRKKFYLGNQTVALLGRRDRKRFTGMFVQRYREYRMANLLDPCITLEILSDREGVRISMIAKISRFGKIQICFDGVFFACVILSLWITYVKGQCDVAFALGITILAVLQWLALSFFIWLRMRWGRKRQMDLFEKFLTKDAQNL